MRKVNRDACAPVKCSGGAAISTIRERRHRRAAADGAAGHCRKSRLLRAMPDWQFPTFDLSLVYFGNPVRG
jgi:hypothetical protein